MSSSAEISVLVNGALGRMGKEVVRAVGDAPDLELVGECDLGDDLGKAIHKCEAQVVVDFTQPASAIRNTETILRAGAHPVVGTTGFQREDITRLQTEAEKLGRGGLIAPNFAIGAVLLMRFAAEAARYLPDVEVIELHHPNKLDSPSGTAMKTIEMIHANLPPERQPPPESTELVERSRGGVYLGVPVHSVRLPGHVAHQEVIFGGLGQTLTIRHDSIDRTSFMPGVVLACQRVGALRTLCYGLETIL